jgi:putative intracellular protease/amidase
MHHQEKGDKVRVDRTLDEAKASEYAALVLPGRESRRVAHLP